MVSSGSYSRHFPYGSSLSHLDGVVVARGELTVDQSAGDAVGLGGAQVGRLEDRADRALGRDRRRRAGYGFGLGFAVRKGNGVASVPGSTGEYNWGGAAGTGFWVDPKEQFVVVIMTQTVPGIAAQRIDRALWRQAVYQALGD